jgi:hypothetical protein
MYDNLISIGLNFGGIGTVCFGYKYYIYKNDYLELKSKYFNTKSVINILSQKNKNLKNDLIEKQKIVDSLDIELKDLISKKEDFYNITPKPNNLPLIL